MRLTYIGISFLLFLSSAAISAQPGEHRHDGMNAVRAYQMQGFALDRGGQRDARQLDAEQDRRRSRAQNMPDSSGYATEDDAGSVPDHARKQGRLSPEERRALRRQIDEAGQDIYTRKR